MEQNVEKSASNVNGKNKIISIVVLVLVVLALGAYFIFGKNKTAAPAALTASVATVNGVAISKAAYDTQLANSIASYKTQGVDVTDATKLSQIKTQVLDNMIGDELVNEGVAAAGIQISPDQVEKQFQVVLTQTGGADKFQAALKQNNLTEAQLRENISKQLAVQTYLLQNIDVKSITVSDAEIAQFYSDYSKAQTASGVKTVPALKDLSAQIKQQITSDKQQTLVANFIASLRAKANVVTETL